MTLLKKLLGVVLCLPVIGLLLIGFSPAIVFTVIILTPWPVLIITIAASGALYSKGLKLLTGDKE